MIHTWTFY